jgi:hypothetical protein
MMCSLGSAIDGACQSARLPGQVKLEVHVEQMLKRLPGDFPDRALPDVGEHGVEELAKERRADACRTVL